MEKEKIRKVFLDKLPRWERGSNKGKINRKECVGHNIRFIYDDIEGELKIVDTDKTSFTVKYLDNKPCKIGINEIFKCKLGRLIGVMSSEFKYQIGENFSDNKRNLTITDREYRKGNNNQNKKYYKYICNVCAWTEGWMLESNLKLGYGCACCANRVAVLGINTIWDTDKWMVDLGVSEEDAKRYTHGTHKKIEVVCPDCSYRKIMRLNAIYENKSINCHCGDGEVYPEKFIIALLNQLLVEFKREYSPTWAKEKRYDFYIPSLNAIIEVHGRQHYEECFNFKRTLAEEQENDRIKEQLALDHDINEYIVIDCQYSDMEYIKNSILKSELAKLFDLSNIDWLKCEEFALKNIVKEVCDYWNNKEDWETTNTIVKNNPWGIKGAITIRKYLSKGTKLGWCSYNPREEMIKAVRKIGKTKGKTVEIFKDGISLGVFKSCAELERQSEDLFGIKLLQSNISQVCRGKKKTHKGYTFKYINNI